MKRLLLALFVACILSVAVGGLDLAYGFDLPYKEIKRQLTEKRCASSWGLDGDVAYIMVYLPARQTIQEFCHNIPMLRSQVNFASWSIRKLNRIQIANLEMAMFRIPLMAFDPPPDL